MIRLSKHDYLILHAALTYGLDDDRDPWEGLSPEDHERAEDIREALAAELGESGEWDVEEEDDDVEEEEDDLPFGDDEG